MIADLNGRARPWWGISGFWPVLVAALTTLGLGASFTIWGSPALQRAVARVPAADAAVAGGWSQVTPAASPPARYSASMAYDATRADVVLFGGLDNNGNATNDTWIFDGTTWAQKTPAASPPARDSASMAYDGVSHTVVLYGGESAAMLGDTWTWDGSTWTQRAMTPALSPSPRMGPSMAYDGTRGDVVLFGGSPDAGSTFLSDTWIWNGASLAWTQSSPAASPPGRYKAAMANDPATGSVVLFGGTSDGFSALAETWVWNGTSWARPMPTTSPPGRLDATMVYDASSQVLMLFGGSNPDAGDLNDVWGWNGSAWIPLPSGTAPPSRFRASMAEDPPTGTIVLFGGFTYKTFAADGDTWAWHGLTVAVLPVMTNGAYGGYVTTATIQNTGSGAAQVSISYFDQSGAGVGPGDTNAALPPNGSWTVAQSDSNSFALGGAGSAIVYSTQPIASFVNEFPPGYVGDATSYTALRVQSDVGATLYAPTIVNNAFGGYTTGIGLLNQGSTPTNVTITYRDGTGATVKTQTVNGMGANAYSGLYSGDPGLGLPNGFAGTATITGSAGALLGAVVNESGPGGQISSYDTAASGSTLLNAPIALNNAFGGYFTGMAIQNTSGTGGSVSVTYYDAAGVVAGAVKSFSISADGSLSVYQGSVTDGPPVGAYAAVIQSSLPLAAIVNEVAPVSGSAQQSTAYNAFPGGSSSVHLALVENGGTDPWNTSEGIMNIGATAATVTVTYYDAGTGAGVGTPHTSTLASNACLGLSQPDSTSGLPAGSRATAVVTTGSGGQLAVVTNESSAAAFMSYDGQ